ncbi:unnamed protein product [Rotaria socialis]|uniref:SET domain-containing protein n=1 Tax=Rotaria socialis TaxID=392032 RepID=A0A820W7M3_9BILA|nr:unnamed protein product [Rotaria socialis]
MFQQNYKKKFNIKKETWCNDRAELRKSPIEGYGLYAVSPIAEGETVMICGGHLWSRSDQKWLTEARYFTVTPLDDEFYIGDRLDDPISMKNYVNHSCDPNLWMLNETTLIARENIQIDEELTIDYAVFSNDDIIFIDDCQCKTKLCRHQITLKDWTSKELQQRFQDHFSTFLNKKIQDGEHLRTVRRDDILRALNRTKESSGDELQLLNAIYRSNDSSSLTKGHYASYAQLQVWVDEQRSLYGIFNHTLVVKPTSTNDYPVAVTITGLRRAFISLIKKHSVLRVSLILNKDNGCLEEVIRPFDELVEEKFSNFIISRASTVAELEEILYDEETNRSLFNLQKGIICRCHVILNSTNRQSNDGLLQDKDYIIFNFHRCCFDDSSEQIFLTDLYSTYMSQRPGAVESQFSGCSALENKKDNDEVQRKKEFWAQLMDGSDSIPNLLTFFTKKDQPASLRTRIPYGASLSFTLDPDIAKQIINYAADVDVGEYLGLFQVCLTSYYIYLYKLTQETNICLGSITAAKREENSELQHVIGLFDDALLYRFKIDPKQTFVEQLISVKNMCLSIRRNAYLPYQDIVDCSSNSNQQYFRLLQNMFTLKVINKGTNLFTLVPKSDRSVYSTKYDLSLNVEYNKAKEECSLSFSFQYSTDLFQHSTMKRIADRFQTLLRQLFSTTFNREKQSIYELSILLPYEIQMYKNLNTTQVEFSESLKPIHEEFFNRAHDYSQKLAIVLDDQAITYSEALFYVQKLAFHLTHKYKVKLGDVICQCAKRSIEMVVGILSILACGAIYFPVNLKEPQDRFRRTILNFNRKFLIMYSGINQDYFPSEYSQINMEQVLLDTHLDSNDFFHNYNNVTVGVDIDAVALPTSGTTGNPKIIRLSHSNLVSQAKALEHTNIVGNCDIILQLAQCSFDVHLEEILDALILGGTLVNLQNEKYMEMDYVRRVIRSNRVTYIDIVPSVLEALLDNKQGGATTFKTIRTICIGGKFDLKPTGMIGFSGKRL